MTANQVQQFNFRAPMKWSQFQLIWLISAVLFCRYIGKGNHLRII